MPISALAEFVLEWLFETVVSPIVSPIVHRVVHGTVRVVRAMTAVFVAERSASGPEPTAMPPRDEAPGHIAQAAPSQDPALPLGTLDPPADGGP